MSRRVYSEINLHITWHTKNNLPLICEKIEANLHAYLKRKAVEIPEIFVHAVGGTHDHIHIAVSSPPTIEIADWIGKLKGASSYYINRSAGNRLLEWQSGYGVVSFGTRDLQWVINYIQHQKEHHAKGDIYERLEKTERIE
jgi:putative transposase